MFWKVLVDESALKKLHRFQKGDYKRLVRAISELSVNPYFGDVKKMKGESNVWRRRVGSYRIFYELYTKRKVVYVYDVKRRTSTTY